MVLSASQPCLAGTQDALMSMICSRPGQPSPESFRNHGSADDKLHLKTFMYVPYTLALITHIHTQTHTFFLVIVFATVSIYSLCVGGFEPAGDGFRA